MPCFSPYEGTVLPKRQNGSVFCFYRSSSFVVCVSYTPVTSSRRLTAENIARTDALVMLELTPTP